ncbi:MAG: sigma-54-dependent Fis family transcriptional regulator [Nitrospinae bacterium]|nr:sigma-54-dependent Fis family transcriptional regulator [Nitrospinota bacterium]
MDKKILIIDDEEEMRAALTIALKRAGYETYAAVNGESGVNCFEEGDFSLVITDVRMPKMTGIEVLKKIKEKSPETPVILITAYSDVNNAVDAMKNGATDFILKPFSADTLSETVSRAFTGNGHVAKPVLQNALGVQGTQSGVYREIVTKNEKVKNLIEIIKRVAPTNAPVLIQGESGTGKELFARAIHAYSNRANNPFIAFNCAAIPENLIESELFGHEKGAFTGAQFKKIGKFEQANKGTIFLDEITEMDIGLQSKLLRVIQEQEIDRVGGTAPVKIDIRIVASTNRKIEDAFKDGHLREDLYYRLNVIPVTLPPLRERRDDIPELVMFFIASHSKKNGVKKPTISKELISKLQAMEWKGNVRELENVIERAVILSFNGEITESNLFPTEFNFAVGQLRSSEPLPQAESGEAAPSTTTLQSSSGEDDISIKSGITVYEMEKKLINVTLEDLQGNRTKAADVLGISIRTLRNKLNEYRDEHASA